MNEFYFMSEFDLIQTAHPFYGGPLDGTWRLVGQMVKPMIFYVSPVMPLSWSEAKALAPARSIRGVYVLRMVWAHVFPLIIEYGKAYFWEELPPPLFEDRWAFELFGLVERDGLHVRINGWQNHRIRRF